MATQKATSDHTHTYSSSEEDTTERSASGQESAKYHFSKALAHRAVYGSSGRRSTPNRKVRSNEAKTLPSRLSKVSLADDDFEKHRKEKGRKLKLDNPNNIRSVIITQRKRWQSTPFEDLKQSKAATPNIA
ncbi:hypothetical protein DITRI_Ditri11bG0114400 [Diplodiscus trichospermus]